MPSIACSALSLRSQSVCANRLAPAITAKRKPVSVCSGGIALGLRNLKTIVSSSFAANPMRPKNSIKLTSPPKGVTGFCVLRI
jgi:hypothetical protein